MSNSKYWVIMIHRNLSLWILFFRLLFEIGVSNIPITIAPKATVYECDVLRLESAVSFIKAWTIIPIDTSYWMFFIIEAKYIIVTVCGKKAAVIRIKHDRDHKKCVLTDWSLFKILSIIMRARKNDRDHRIAVFFPRTVTIAVKE